MTDARGGWLDAARTVLGIGPETGDHRPLLDDDPIGRCVDGRRAGAALPRGRRSAIGRATAPQPRSSPTRCSTNCGAPVIRRSFPWATAPTRCSSVRAPGATWRRAATWRRRAAVVTQDDPGVDVDRGVEHQAFTSATARSTSRWRPSRRSAATSRRGASPAPTCVVGVGGGMVTDVAGFAAAVYHRGVAGGPRADDAARPWSTPPSAARRGSTCPRARTWSAPSGNRRRSCATPRSSRRCPRERAAQRARRDGQVPLPDRRRPLAALPLDERVARCVEIKAEVVAADEREGGRRAMLNYGHTLAHALEIADGYDLRHGEAVGVGLVFAAELARRLGRIGRGPGRRAPPGGRRATTSEPTLPEGSDPDELVALMGRDKKALDGLTFVLDGPAGVEVVAGVGRRDVIAERWRTASMSGAAAGRAARPARAEPQPARRARAGGLRHGDPRRLRRAATSAAAASGLDVEASSRTTRASWSTPSTARGDVRGDRHQPRRAHPLRLVAARRAGRVRRPDHRAAPVQPERPGSRGGTRRWSRRSPPGPSWDSALTDTSWPRGGSPSWFEHDRPGPRRPAAAMEVGRAGRDGCATRGRGGVRRPARHRPRRTSATSPGSPARPAVPLLLPDEVVLVTDGRYGDQASEQLTAAGSAARPRRATQSGPGGPPPPRRAGSTGVEAESRAA